MKISKELKWTLLLFVITRVILTIIGVVSRLLLEPFHGKEYVWHYSRYLWLDIWGVWDSGWYLNIASNWYPKGGVLTGESNYGFFPLYPLLMKIVGILLRRDYFIAGIIVSNFALIIACLCLFKLVKLESDEEAGLKSIKYLLLFPSAFIFSGVFSESVAIALAIASFYYAKKNKWFLAGISGLFFSLSRPIGFLLFLPLLFEYLKNIKFKISKIRLNILFLFLIPIGLFLFFFYLYYLTGDWLAFIQVKQKGWGHALHNPFDNIYKALMKSKEAHILFPAYLTLAVVLILTLFFRKIGFSYWLFGMFWVFLPIAGSCHYPSLFVTMLRFICLSFPLYIIFAQISKNYYIDLCLTIIFSLLQGFLMVFWCNGFWFIV